VKRYLAPLVLVVLVAAACTTSRAPISSMPAAPTRLVGTWELVSTRVTRGDSVLLQASAPEIRAVTILNHTDYSVVTRRGTQFLRAGAGHYTLNGDTYTETVDLASGQFTSGRTYTYRVHLDGDTWTIDGGPGAEQFHEVRRRIR
jgi:hypothetical protein